jgi:murein DD-endopeptidase MepM/ murein hydrolase activator NlpD
MRKPPAAVMIGATLLAAAAMMAFVRPPSRPGHAPAKIGFQDSDRPLDIPASAAIDHRFQSVDAWTTARIPTALRWDPPMGSEHGALTYNAQPFLEPNPKRGGPHLGDDLNGIGGMDSDQGDPIFAAADGLILYAGAPSAGWGNTVILAHRTASDDILHTMYAHLDRIHVAVGSLVARGQILGTNGTANGNYPAHLHLELRASHHIDIGGGYGHSLNRLNPMATIRQQRGAADDHLAPSPLPLALRSFTAWTGLAIQGAEHMPALHTTPDP